MVIGEWENNRVTQWKMDDTNGQVVAGGHDQGNRLDQLSVPTDVLIDKESDSLIICDLGNQRVVQWSRRSGTTQGKILTDNIDCYGLAMDDQRYLYISDYTKHEVRRYQIGDKNGTLVAGGNGEGAGLNQLNAPGYIFVDRRQTVYVSDYRNHRVMKWKKGAKKGIIVAGGQGAGNATTQISLPQGNQRVVQWSRRSGTTQGKIFTDNVDCYGLAMDDQRYLYISDYTKHEVRRYQIGDKNGTLVAGGNGEGADLNQLNAPGYIFVDRRQTIYVSDYRNHRVMKWKKGAKKGIIVAGGQGAGNATTQISLPQGLFVDTLGTIYVADKANNRVMRWPKGAKHGTVIAGGNGQGAGADQFNDLE
ncbi:unnamed protein product, partial [Rotaria sp. Silwood1]